MCILHTFSNLYGRTEEMHCVGAICLQLRCQQNEEGPHVGQFFLDNEDGDLVWESTPFQFEAKFPNDILQSLSLSTMTLFNARVAPGTYELRCVIDGRELINTPLCVILIK